MQRRWHVSGVSVACARGVDGYGVSRWPYGQGPGSRPLLYVPLRPREPLMHGGTEGGQVQVTQMESNRRLRVDRA